MKYERLTDKNDLYWALQETKLSAEVGIYLTDCINRLAELEDKIENGTLIEFPRITETVYGLEWTVEYVSNMRTGTGIAKVFCGTKEQAKAVLEIVKKYGYPKEELLKELQE